MSGLVADLWPYILAAVAFLIATQAVEQGPGVIVSMITGKPVQRGIVPKSTGNWETDVEQAAGYLEAQKRAARRQGAAAYRSGQERKRSGYSGSYRRERSPSRGRRG